MTPNGECLGFFLLWTFPEVDEMKRQDRVLVQDFFFHQLPSFISPSKPLPNAILPTSDCQCPLKTTVIYFPSLKIRMQRAPRVPMTLKCNIDCN